MKYCISYRRVHTRFMVTYVLFPLQSSLRAWSHKHGVILSRWKHEPLKARLYLLRDRESVDKFASFKLIDLVGSSIILEQFGSTLMEIISLPLILFFSIHISISIIFPQFSISNSYPRFRLEIRNFIRDLFQINQYRDESRFTLFGKFRSIVSESNSKKARWISSRSRDFSNGNLLFAIALHREAIPETLIHLIHFRFLPVEREIDGGGEKKNAITRPFKYLPNDETGKDSASNRTNVCGWFR